MLSSIRTVEFDFVTVMLEVVFVFDTIASFGIWLIYIVCVVKNPNVVKIAKEVPSNRYKKFFFIFIFPLQNSCILS